MPRKFNQHLYPVPSAITTAGNTGALPNLSQAAEVPSVSALITVGSVTGTTPSITFGIDVSVDGTNWFPTGAVTSAVTAAGKYRVAANNIVEPYVRVSWPAPTGTTPSFGSVTVNLVFN